MTEHSRIGPNGEVIVPDKLREHLDWRPGMEVEMDATAGELVVRRKAEPRERISWEEFRRRVPPHEGPPVTIEEMNQAIEEERAERWARKERRSR